jgi:asparagine synthase (glutamine-hydrolysing)
MDHGWATIFDVSIRLSKPKHRNSMRFENSNSTSAYSGWLRDLRTGDIFSSFRQDPLTVNPTKTPVLGEYSHICIDSDRITLMTDHYGTHPVYYWRGENEQWIASNDLRLVTVCHLVSVEIRKRSCIDFLAHSVMVGENELAGEATFFSEVLKAPSNCILTISRSGQKSGQHSPADNAAFAVDNRAASRAEFEHNFRAQFDDCVRDRIKAGAGGILLSGGVDSTTVLAASLAGQNGAIPFCANMSFRDADLAMSQDDKFVTALVKQCGIPHQIIYADDFLRFPLFDEMSSYIDGPDTAANPLVKEACARVFQDNDVSLVMTGEGGDIILGESMHRWILDSIRIHEGLKSAHDYVTKTLGFSMLSTTYIRKILTSLSPHAARYDLAKSERAEQKTDFPEYILQRTHYSLNHNGAHEAEQAKHLRSPYIGHHYIRAMLFPRATYFDALNTHCTLSHPFLDPRMISFALTCPPHFHFDHKNLDRNNPYATSKMLARNAYRTTLPPFASEKRHKTSYALMARKMFLNSAKDLLRLATDNMILNDWGIVNQDVFRKHVIAYTIVTEDPNAQLGTQYHFLRGVADLEKWIATFSGTRSEINQRLKFRPLRALAT